MLKVGLSVLLGLLLANVADATDTCDVTGASCEVELDDLQKIILKVFAWMADNPDEHTASEHVSFFEVWQLTNPSAAATQKWYNLWSKTYDNDMIGVGYIDPAYVANEVVATGIPLDALILDVGTGSGQGGLQLKKRGYTTIDASDGNPEMLAIARKNGAYRNFIPCMAVSGGGPLCDIAEGTYDLLTSSGAFYPFHLMGEHLATFVTTVKVGGFLIISSCPHSDVNLGLRAAVYELQNEGVILLRKEEYIDDWFHGFDGTLYKMERLK